MILDRITLTRWKTNLLLINDVGTRYKQYIRYNKQKINSVESTVASPPADFAFDGRSQNINKIKDNYLA